MLANREQKYMEYENELFAQTVSRAQTKWLHHILSVRVEPIVCPQPSLGNKLLWEREIRCIMVGCIMVSGNSYLHDVRYWKEHGALDGI